MDHRNAKGISLRPVACNDGAFLTRLYRDARVRQYLGGPSKQQDFVARARELAWFRVIEVAGAPAGYVSLSDHCDGGTELSYQLMPDYWGQGVASYAVGQALRYGFGDMGLVEIIAETQAANHPSRRLLERLGFTERRQLQRFGAQQVIYGITSACACPDPSPQAT